MWILEQGKEELCNIDQYRAIVVASGSTSVVAYKDEDEIYNEGHEWELGEYEDEKRCKEVIAEIAKHIHMGDRLYEMPDK